MVGAHEQHGTSTIPFWVHQVVELLLAVLLLVQSARTGQHAAVLVGLGVALLLLVLCSNGVLGAWPWIGRRLHRALDLVVAIALALSPLLLSLDGVFAIVILELAAFAMIWLALRTDWRTRPRTEPRTARRRVPAPPPTPTGPPVTAVPLARKLGAGAARVRGDGPRQLGRLVGRARRATRASFSPPDDGEPDPPTRP